MAGLTLLNDEQLRQLAKIVYHKEAEAIQNIKFKSEPERAKYLRDCKACYESTVGLLDAELERKYQNDETRAPIAHDIFSYAVKSVNLALLGVRNYSLRMNYINKIGEHAKTLMNELRELDPKNVMGFKRLAEEAAQSRNAMKEYTGKYQSTASRNFSKWLNKSGMKFQDLLEKYQKKLNFKGPFNNLENAQKIQVYEEIIEASGRGKVVDTQLSKVFGYAGIVVLLFTAGMMVWDIFSSDHILHTATRDAVVTLSLVGGSMAGQVVGTALATQLLVGVEASAFFVLTAGIITGIAGAFILGEFAGWFIDFIFGSGGSTPLSTDGHRCYVTPMPDGEVLARQIAHHTSTTSQTN